MEVDPEELAEMLEQTYKDISRKLKIPGFRKGKIPRKVIDSHLGPEHVRIEAIKSGLPGLYVKGVRESGIFPVSDPEIKLIEAGENGKVIFEAKVDVKPEIEIKDYKGLEIKAPESKVTEDDVNDALDEARNRFATLEVVETRPAGSGDFVMFDYKVFADGEPLEGKSGADRMIEIGADDFLPGFDEQLEGARKGDILDVVVTFPPEYGEQSLAGKPATFRTMVKEVKKKVLPALDDDLAKNVSEFETLVEFKDDLRKRIALIKERTVKRAIRERVTQALVDRTYIDLPDSIVERQVQREIKKISDELSGRGISLDDYLAALKETRYQLEKVIRDNVVDELKTELVVDAVAKAESIEVSDEEAVEYIKENALAGGENPATDKDEIYSDDMISGVKANLRLSKGIDLLVENAVITCESPASPLTVASVEDVETGDLERRGGA